jgi:phosphatidylethanolamine N-methyltransferase
MIEVQKYIDFTESKFIEANIYSVLCFALWVILPHLQFRYKLLSRFVGNDEEKACDFLSYFLIYTGTIRNHAINEAINNNIHINYGIWEYPILLLSTVLMIFGLVLVSFSFYRLGLRGMYFGDHFGFLFKEKIIQFPYNYFDNAQYVGTTAFFIGYSLFFHSPAGIFITILINLLYKVLTFVENRKLKIFYPDTKEN